MTAVRSTDFETIHCSSFPIQTVRCSPDDRYLLIGDTDRNLTVMEYGVPIYSRSLKSRNEKVQTTERIREIAFSPDGEFAYISCGDAITAIRLSDGFTLWKAKNGKLWGFLTVMSLGIDVADDGRIAMSFDSGAFGIRNAQGQRMKIWKDNSGPRWLGFTEGGTALLGSDGFTILKWDTDTGQRSGRFNVDERVYGMAFSPAQRNMFVVRTLHNVALYTIENPEPILRIPVREGLPLLAFNPTDGHLAIGWQHGVDVYDLDGQLCQSVSISDAAVLSIAFFSSGRSLIIGTSDGDALRVETTSTILPPPIIS